MQTESQKPGPWVKRVGCIEISLQSVYQRFVLGLLKLRNFTGYQRTMQR